MVAAAIPHHVTPRGNNREAIFLTADDRLFCLAILREKSEPFGLSILGYCLWVGLWLARAPSVALSNAATIYRACDE